VKTAAYSTKKKEEVLMGQ